MCDFRVPSVTTFPQSQSRIELPFKRLKPDTESPVYAHVGDAGLDLRAAEPFTLGPMEQAVIGTGLAVAIPEGYAGFLTPRSGLAARHGVTITNSPGLIDSGYRGEIKGIIANLGAKPVDFDRGERVMQLVIVPIPHVTLREVDELPDSDRGMGGLGSTGTR